MPVPKDGETKLSEQTLDAFVGYRIRRAWLAIQADLTLTLKPFELRMITYAALALVGDNPGLRQGQLATLMDMERPNLVAIIDELEQRRLLTRERTKADRRAYALNLTAQGRVVTAQATAAVAAHEARLTGGLSESERKALNAVLGRIRRTAEET